MKVKNHLVLGAVGALFLCSALWAVTIGRGVSQQGAWLASGTGAVLQTLETGERRVKFASDYGVVCDGSTDNTTNMQAAINAAAPGTLYVQTGTCMTGQLTLPTGIHLVGSGMHETTLKTKASANVPMLVQAATNTTFVEIRDLELDGNDANNTTGGCLSWTPTVGSDGPGITLQNVHITRCQAGAANGEAVLIWGVDWADFKRVRINQNRKAIGLYIKGSDGHYEDVYLSSNGGDVGSPGLVIQQGSDNRFIGSYFGGGDGAEAVKLAGAIYSNFVNCTNDSAWTTGYRFVDSGGTASQFNSIVGGHVTNPGRAADNTYDHFSFEGAASNNRVVAVSVHNNGQSGTNPTFKGRYAVTELNTAGNNMFVADRFGTFGTGVSNLRSGGGSQILESLGYVFGAVGASYNTATAQTMSSGAFTVVNFDTQDYDTNSAVTTGAAWHFTAPFAGVYDVSGSIGWAASVGGTTVVAVSIYKNGSEAKRLFEADQLNNTTTFNPVFAGMIKLAAGDTIDVRMLQFATTSALRTTAAFNHVSIQRIPGS